MKKTLLIPSAGFAKRLYPLSQFTPKVLIKLNGVPILHLLYKQAVKMKMDNIVIAINPEFKRQVQEFIDTTYKNSTIPIHLATVDNQKLGVLYSLKCGFEYDKCHENVLVILSDTLYTGKIPINSINSFIFYEKVKGDLSRWCLIETNKSNQITKFWDKPQKKCPTNKAVIGIYYLYKSIFLKCANEVINSKLKIRNEYQISQALEKYMKYKNLFGCKTEENCWHDTGTLVNLKNASLNFLLSREFNSIKWENGVLIKSSENKDKLKDEYNWYLNISNKSIIPSIYDYKEYESYSKIKMEHCNLNDLGTTLNFCNAEKVFFSQTINYILSELKNILYKNITKFDVYNGLVDKFINRTININIDKEFTRRLVKLSQKGYLTKIHGDLILSNILFDPQKMMFKLIDPRGSFGEHQTFGDLRYDLAKLLHSLDGKYETIIHNLYDIKDNKIIYYMNKEKEECFKSGCNEIFKFAESFGITKEELKLIEASLFFSMIPLHYEDKKRQKAFYLIGQKIWREIK